MANTYMISYFQISPYILEISWPAEISEDTLAEIILFKSIIKEKYGPHLKDCVSGYHALSLHFSNPYEKFTVVTDLTSLYKEIDRSKSIKSNLWKIPVYYNGKDLERFSTSLNIPTDEIISIHSHAEYIVHFYGFMPGFLYLGGLDPRLHHPRKENPDRTVPAGSLAIGGKQTGIYPQESPGGWHIIGSCPVKFFDPNSNPAVWAKEGDKIRFYTITLEEFDNMKLLGNGLIKDPTDG